MEQYKDIEGYEGIYQVSNDGNVKSLNYNHTGNERILRPAVNRSRYLYVILCKDGKIKSHQVHRLVAQAFLPNIENLPQVNHKDEVKTHNCVENLEWCTHEYNQNYGTRNARIAEAQINRTDQSIPIDMLTKSGELIRQFPSSHETERWLRINGFPKAAHQSITSCCKGKRDTAYGFKWRYSQGN